MSRKSKLITILTIFTMLALVLVPSVAAFDGREGDHIVIGPDEVVEDDLYIGAETVTIDGTIEGDLYTGAQTVTINGVITGNLVTGAQVIVINGTVEGDVIAFGQSVVVSGTVGDDLRTGAAAIQIKDAAQIGDDLLFGGASMELMPGAEVGGDLLIGGAQALVEGDIAGNLLVGSSALELTGSVAGDVTAYVNSLEDSEGAPPMLYFGPQMNISMPTVAPGLTITDSAKINGNLTYSATSDMDFPSSAIDGGITRVEPEVYETMENIDVPAPPTPQQVAGFWFMKLLRTIITLLALGILMQWLFPNFLASAEYKLRTDTWGSLGWGVVAYAFFFFALLVVFTGMILGAIFFGVLSLGGLSGTIVILGLLLLFALIVGFVLTVTYLTKIIVATLGGKLLLARIKPEWANHKFYPLAFGVVILAIIMAVPIAGWLVKLIVVLFALGALWLLGRDQFGKKSVPAEA